MNDLIRRQRALEQTVARFRGKPLDWKHRDCVRMARSHLVAMGHRKLPKLPRYSSPAGAKRALKAAGFGTVEEMLSSILPAIPPAAMLPGDLAILEGDGSFDAITISMGRKLMGWHAENEFREPVNIEDALQHVKAAFRA